MGNSGAAIKHLDAEGALPITVMTREAFERSGAGTPTRDGASNDQRALLVAGLR